MDMGVKRVAKLRAIVGQSDSIAAFARTYGLDATYISQLLNGHRQFGERAARNMEEKMGLPPMFFDIDPVQERGNAPTPEEWRAFSTEELSEIAREVLSELSRRATK